MKGVIKVSLLALSVLTGFTSYAESKSVEALSAVVKDQKISGAQVVIQRNSEHSHKWYEEAISFFTESINNYSENGKALLDLQWFAILFRIRNIKS